MNSRKLFATLLALAMVSFAGIASADIIDPLNCFATVAEEGGLTVSPGGWDAIGPVHTITVYVNDQNNAPVEILATDIWLEHENVVWCPGGVVADSSTYAPDPGVTTFTSVPRGGVDQGIPGAYNECSGIHLNVVALGYVIEVLSGDEDDYLTVNSMDLDGSGVVEGADFARYGRCNNNGDREGCSCADYNFDFIDEFGDPVLTPVVDINDFAKYGAQHNGSTCP